MNEKPGIAVRLATPQDAATVARFNIACARDSEGLELDESQARAGAETALRDPSRGRYYLAEDATGTAGQIMITREWSDWRNAWTWWMQSVYVRPEARRRGVFRALLRFIESAARDEGVGLLRLYMDKDNRPAENAYHAEGFATSHYRLLDKAVGRS